MTKEMLSIFHVSFITGRNMEYNLQVVFHQFPKSWCALLLIVRNTRSYDILRLCAALDSIIWNMVVIFLWRGRHSRDCMVVEFTTTYAIRAYHHWCCEFEFRSGRGVQHYLIKFVSDLYGRSVVFSGYSSFLHQ
jgi:hypothetical protein